MTTGIQGTKCAPPMSSTMNKQHHLDRELHAGVQDVGEDEHLAWERDPPYQARVRRHRSQAERRDQSEEVPGEQTAQQEEREVVESGRDTDRCRGVEQRAEHEAVDEDLRQRVEHRPCPPEERAAVLRAEFSECEIPQQLARAVDIGDGMHGRREVIAMLPTTSAFHRAHRCMRQGGWFCRDDRQDSSEPCPPPSPSTTSGRATGSITSATST